jgi:hypothetical protein
MLCRLMTVTALSTALIAASQFDRGADGSQVQPAKARIAMLTPTTLEGELARSAEMDEAGARRHVFAAFVARINDELGRGDTSLAAATERLFYYCLQNYPEYFENIWSVEAGAHIKTKIAQNLVRAFQPEEPAQEPRNCREAAIVVRLERELHELPYEAAAEPSAPCVR